MLLLAAGRRRAGARCGTATATRASAAAAGVLAVAAFCVLAAAGLPIITRYVLLAGRRCSRSSPARAPSAGATCRAGSQRTWWARFAALALVVLALFVPSQAQRIDRLADALGTQEAIQGDLGRVVKGGVPCEPVTVPNRRPIPLLALWLKLDPGAIGDAQAAAAGARDVPRAAHARRSRATTSSTGATATGASPRRRRASHSVRTGDAWVAAARC